MKWTNVLDIAIALEEKYPEADIYNIGFTDLRKKVLELEEFADKPNGCNEKILEAIQANWIDERE